MAEHDGPILEIENLSISFFTRLREIPAVMDFSVTVRSGWWANRAAGNPPWRWGSCRTWA